MTQTANRVTDIPFLGVGLGYRQALKEGIFAFKDEIDFLEIITEQYIHKTSARDQLEKVCEQFQVIPLSETEIAEGVEKLSGEFPHVSVNVGILMVEFA